MKGAFQLGNFLSIFTSRQYGNHSKINIGILNASPSGGVLMLCDQAGLQGTAPS